MGLGQTDGTQASVLIQDDRVPRGGQGGQRGGQRGHQGGRGPGKGGRGGCPDVPTAKGCLHQLYHLLPVVDGRLFVGLAWLLPPPPTPLICSPLQDQAPLKCDSKYATLYIDSCSNAFVVIFKTRKYILTKNGNKKKK